MSERTRKLIILIAYAVGAFYAYGIVTLGRFYFPTFTFALFFSSLATLLYYLKKEKTRYDTMLYGIVCALSVCLIFRSNWFLIFLNMLGCLYLGSLFILHPKERENINILYMLFLPLIQIFKHLGGKNTFELQVKDYGHHFSAKRVYETLISLFITMVIFAIIIPLLSSANPFFEKLVGEFFKTFNFLSFLSGFFGPYFFGYMLRLMVFLFFCAWIPRLMTYTESSDNNGNKQQNAVNIPLLIPKILTSLLLLVFFVTQIQLYMASDTTLKAMGMMNSEHAREVFAQLSVVAFIIFGLLYIDRGTSRWHKITSYILLIEVVFLNCMALKSVYEYTVKFGFTHKRLYGYTGVIWLFGAVALFIYSYKTVFKRSEFIRNIVIYTGIILITVNIANFDYLIYHVSQPRTGEGIDRRYMAQMLTADADADIDEYNDFTILFKKNQGTLNDTYGAMSLANRIQFLQSKYSNEGIDWRHFNWAEYMQYGKVKDLHVNDFITLIYKRQNQLYPTLNNTNIKR